MYVLHPFKMALTRNNYAHTQAYVITPSHNPQKKNKIHLLDKDYTLHSHTGYTIFAQDTGNTIFDKDCTVIQRIHIFVTAMKLRPRIVYNMPVMNDQRRKL